MTAKRESTAGGGETAAVCPTCGHQPGESCTACPLCRFLAVLRGERPEATARWVDGALIIVQALRSLIPAADARRPTSRRHRRPDPPPQRLQHIEIQ